MHWTYDAPGAPMRLAFAFPTLIIELEDNGSLSAGGAYSVTVAGETRHGSGALEPDPETSDSLTAFTGDLAVRAWSDDQNDFYLESNSGNVLCISGKSQWEAWDFNGPDGSKVVCMPGGELATWAPDN